MSHTEPAWPMPSYMSAWKTFRQHGDEPARTAAHVMALESWPKKAGLRVLDIGSGDGHMVGAFVEQASGAIGSVTMLDPFAPVREEGVALLRARAPKVAVYAFDETADEAPTRARDADVGLAIHVTYLMPDSGVKRLIQRWPSGVPLFVVVDAPDSIFRALWSETAPDFAQRSAYTHALMEQVAAAGRLVGRSDFTTRVVNPFTLEEPLASRVASLLCYAEYDELGAPQQARVRSVIAAHEQGGAGLSCKCTCYAL